MRKLSALILFGLFLATPTNAAEDNFGRPFYAALSLAGTFDNDNCDDQWGGLRFTQVREGLPGIWFEGRGGPNWKNGNAGITQRINEYFAVVLGGGIAFDGDHPTKDNGFSFHSGLVSNVHGVVLHCGYDTRPGLISFGVGWAFLR